LRHLEGIKGTIGVSENEYISATVLGHSKPKVQLIRGNASGMIEQGQYVFDMLWNAAIPYMQKLRHIEHDDKVKYETAPLHHINTDGTIVLDNIEETIAFIKSVLESATERSVIGPIGALQIVYDNFFNFYKRIVDKHRKGEGKGVRWITSIYEDNNIGLVKLFLEAGIQVRHIRNLPPLTFAVDDRYFYSTIEEMEEGKLMQNIITSNQPLYIKHFTSIFEQMWKNAVDAKDRIKNIEDRIEEVEPKISYNEENIKHYLDEAMKEIEKIRGLHRRSGL
jgi:two-component system, OmpR family, sensor histidine kinase VicK